MSAATLFFSRSMSMLEVASVGSARHSPADLTWPFAKTLARPAPSAPDRGRERANGEARRDEAEEADRAGNSPRVRLGGRARGDDRAADRALLARISRGEVAALRALYDQHGGRAMAIAMRVLRSEPEAEDVVQETFLEIWRRAAQYDNQRGGAVAWVVTIARSRAIDRLRSTGTASRAIEAASGAIVPPLDPLPSDEAERRRDEARVAAALETLPVEQKQAIELAYFEGLSQTEIAARTGSPLGTVKMRVKLAMKKLAKLLNPE